MNTPAPYQADGNGGRQSAVSQSPPLSYRRAPVRELRALPVRRNLRVQVLDFRLTEAPGLTPSRKARTYGHGSVRLAGGFVLALCLTRDAGEWWLEVQPAPFDEALARPVPFAPPRPLLASIFRAVQSRQIACEGRAYGRGEGRN